MRSIGISILILLLFTSCGVKSDNFSADELSISSIEQGTVFSESIAVSTDIVLPIESVPVDTVLLVEEPYSFSEINPVLGPGPFSVNELSEIFGKPSSVEGYYYNRNFENGYYVISVIFQDVKCNRQIFHVPHKEKTLKKHTRHGVLFTLRTI